MLEGVWVQFVNPITHIILDIYNCNNAVVHNMSHIIWPSYMTLYESSLKSILLNYHLFTWNHTIFKSPKMLIRMLKRKKGYQRFRGMLKKLESFIHHFSGDILLHKYHLDILPPYFHHISKYLFLVTFRAGILGYFRIDSRRMEVI